MALIVLFLFPNISWSNSISLGYYDSFPNPYLYKNKGIETKRAKFTINKSGVLPNWVSLAIQHRNRYEILNNQFRSGKTGSDQVLSLRTLIQSNLYFYKHFKIKIKFQDSRAELGDSDTPLNNIINAKELLEFNIQWLKKGLFQKHDRSILRVGRITIDIGKRRLIARNRFRNTINGFTGVDWIWKTKNKLIRTFITTPLVRKPIASKSLLNNEAELDEENFD